MAISAQDGDAFWTRFNAPREEKLWFIETRTGILTKRLPQRTTAELLFHSGALQELLSQSSSGEGEDVLLRSEPS